MYGSKNRARYREHPELKSGNPSLLSWLPDFMGHPFRNSLTASSTFSSSSFASCLHSQHGDEP